MNACASQPRRIGAGTGTSIFSLRFLIDNALPRGLAELLCAAKQDAMHLRTYGMQAAKHETVARAIQEDRLIVSADSNFSGPCGSRCRQPSFILFRDPPLPRQA